MAEGGHDHRLPEEYILGRREFNNFLKQFYLTSELRDKLNISASAEKYPSNEDDILKQIKEIWEEDGLVSPLELIEKLLTNAMGTDAQLLPHIMKIEQELYNPNAAEPFFQKEHSELLSALAHAYALEGRETVTVLEGDGLNIGGTNDECFRRILKEKTDINDAEKSKILALLNLSSTSDTKTFQHHLNDAPESIRKNFQEINAQSLELVDQVLDLLKLAILKTVKKKLPEHAKIIPIRNGGDEFRIILTGVQPEGYVALLNEIHNTQKTYLEKLGLTHHRHRKKDHQQGTGLIFSALDMRCISSNDTFHTCSAADIQCNKTRISQSYQETQNISITPADMQVHLQEENQKLRLALNLELQKSTAPPNLLQQFEKAQYNAPLFTPPNRMRRLFINALLTTEGIELDVYQQRYLANLIRRTTPIDPVTGFYMDYDLEKIINIYNRDGKKLLAMLQEQGSTPHPLECSATLITIEAQNLGGLNEALTHYGANRVLRYIKEHIIEDSLRDAEINVPSQITSITNIHGVHCGGGKFVLILPPARYGITRPYTEEDLWKSGTLDTIQKALHEKATALNQSNIDDILGEECPEELHNQQISTIPSDNPSKAIKGIPFSWSFTPIDFSEEISAAEFIAAAWNNPAPQGQICTAPNLAGTNSGALSPNDP